MRTAIDTNVISALWCAELRANTIVEALGKSRDAGGLVISGVVFAELCAHPRADQPFVEGFLETAGVEVDFLFDEELWRTASRHFAMYAIRRRSSDGGHPKRLLADFLVGAHAMLRADRLVTLDSTRYQKDFPELKIVSWA